MITLCLDTNAYSRLRLGHPPLTARLEQADSIVVPATVLGELHAGFNLGSRVDKNRNELNAFLRVPGVLVRQIDAAIAERYGIVLRQLRDQGTPIPANDIWIAAVSLETGSRLVTYDEHFEKVPGVLVEAP